MSPGFTPRPSLSAVGYGSGGLPLGCVAGVHAPAFVERRWSRTASTKTSTSVAGVHAPAFVERPTEKGFDLARELPASVAGVHAPAFVERWRTADVSAILGRRVLPSTKTSTSVAGVHAPAFVEREKGLARLRVAGVHAPSLSDPDRRRLGHPRPRVSPGFTPRPSLSEDHGCAARWGLTGGVAGVHAPAFVERIKWLCCNCGQRRLVA